MKEYLIEKYKRAHENSIFGSEDGPEAGGTNVNQANADRLGSGFARLMPPLANDLLLSSADLTASDFVSEGPIEGFVDNSGTSCSPLEATFLDGTVVAETVSLKKQSQPLIIQKLKGVEFNYKPFVSGELNNYVDYLDSRFVHKEPIVNHSWIQGRSDINGDYNSTVNTFRGGVINPLQDINDILNCTRQGLKNTIMRWGPGAKGVGGATDTAEMEIAPNEMLYRYAGAGFRKVPYSYRKIYHPNSVVNKTDYSIPTEYVFSEDQPVLYQGSYDFGCSITERGFLDRSFCNRAFFKFIANPTSSNNGNYSNHQRFCATAVRISGHYNDRFPNGKPGKYTYSLAAQAEPEGLKEPIIDTVASAINSMGLDYWKPVRFHESYVQLTGLVYDRPSDHHSRTRRVDNYNKSPRTVEFQSGSSTHTRTIDDGIVTYNTWTSRRIYVEKGEASLTSAGTVTEQNHQTTPGASLSSDQPKLVDNLAEYDTINPLRTQYRLFNEKLVVMDEVGGSENTTLEPAVIGLNWIVDTNFNAYDANAQGVFGTRSWKLDTSDPVTFFYRGSNYRGTPTLNLFGVDPFVDLATNTTIGSLPTLTFEVGEGGALTNNVTVTNAGSVEGVGAGAISGPPIRQLLSRGFYAPDYTPNPLGNTYSISIDDVNPTPGAGVVAVTRAFLQEGSLPGVSGNTQRWYKPNKTYRITGSLHFPQSNVKVDSFNFYLLGDQSQGIEGQNIATVGPFKDDIWRDFDFEFTNSGNRSFRKMRFNLKKGNDFTGLTQTGDFVGIRDFTVLEKTLGGEEQAKDPRIAYMTFAAKDFLSTGTTLNVPHTPNTRNINGPNHDYPFTTNVSLGGDTKIDFSLDGTPINVGDPNALKFVFPKITGFDLSTKQINESITVRTVTNETESCNTRNQEDMKYPFVTGAENTETVGFQLKESETEDVEGAFLWPVWVGDSPPKNYDGTLDTGKLFVRLTGKNQNIANNATIQNAIQSGIDNGYDVFGYIEPDAPVFGTPVEFELQMGSLLGTTSLYGILDKDGNTNPHPMDGVYRKSGTSQYYRRDADNESEPSDLGSNDPSSRHSWINVRGSAGWSPRITSSQIDDTVDISSGITLANGQESFVGLKNGIFRDDVGNSIVSTGRNTNNSVFNSINGSWTCMFDQAYDSTPFNYYPYDYFDSYDDFGWTAMKGDQYDTSSSTSTSFDNGDHDNPWDVPSWKFNGIFASVSRYYGPQSSSPSICPVAPGDPPQPGCDFPTTSSNPYYYSLANIRRVTPVGHPFDPKPTNFKNFIDEHGQTGQLILDDGESTNTFKVDVDALPSGDIFYLHVANPNLGAPDANVTGKSLNITVQQNQPETFNFNNFRIDYNLGEENQEPLSNESVTTIEYNKNIYGPNEIFRAGSVIGEQDIATAEVSLARFDYGTGPLSHRGATYYRWRISNVNITNGGSNYSNNVTLNFNSNLGIYQNPNPTVNVNNGVVQSVSFANTAAKGEFEGSGFIFGNYSAHTYDHLSPVVTAQIVDEAEGDVTAGDLSLNLTGDNTDYNYGMRKYSAIDGTASSDIESDGTYQSDWMENLPLNADITPLIHTVSRRDVDCVKITLIIESLYQQLIQEQDPLSTSIKRDGLTINFSIFTYFDGVVEGIYPKNETKISYFGTVNDFYAVDTDEIILPTYSDLLPFYPEEDAKSLSQKFPRIVEVRKNDFETNSVRMARDARVFQVTEVVKERFKYPFSAIMKTTLDARTFREPPNKQWRLRLKRVQVPSNYYPLDLDGSDKRFVKNVSQLGTRIVYDGDWDGTFKLAWTDNPAWILYDLLTNQRYGIGNRIDDLEDINIFNLYKIGRYCDSVDDNGNFVGLDDGVGGLEPRFSCNIMLASAQNAFKTINDICTVFNGMSFWANGRLDFFADQPKEPMTFFNNENVFDGIFNYQTTSKSSLFNVAEVTFLDKRDDFTAKKESVIDEESMRQNGILRRDINGKGCTSRAQAARLGRYILYTNKLEREIVNFKTSSQSLMLSIGDVIEIQDELKNFEASYGALLEVEINSAGKKFIKIEDRPNVNSILTNHSGAFVITPTGQDTLTELYDHIKGGNLVTNEILNNLYDPQAVKLEVTGAQQDGNQIKIGVLDPNSHLNDVPTGSLINLDLQNRRKHQYRVLSIKPEEDNLYAVTATEYRKEKFDLIETKEDFKIEEEDSFNVGIPNHVIKNITEPIGFDANVVTVNSRERHIQFEITGSSNGNETAYQLTAIAPNGKVDNKIVHKAEDISVGNNYYLTKGEIKNVNSFGTYNFEVKSLGSEDIFGTPTSIDFTNALNLGTPTSLDTDGDGLTDIYENTVSFTDPNNTDTDFDGLSDSEEINTHGTNPLSKDSDNDGVDDDVELDLGQNPAVFTDYNPLVSGFRITNVVRQTGEYYAEVGKGDMGMASGLPIINGLYQVSGTANGKPRFAGRRHNYISPVVGGGYTNSYISSDNPYKNIYTAGAGIVEYTADGYWKIETNTTAVSYDSRRDFQQWTGGSGVDYPWQVTEWVQLLQSGTFKLANVDYTDPQNKPEPSGPKSAPRIFFTYLGDGTLVNFAPKL